MPFVHVRVSEVHCWPNTTDEFLYAVVPPPLETICPLNAQEVFSTTEIGTKGIEGLLAGARVLCVGVVEITEVGAFWSFAICPEPIPRET